MFHVRGIFSYNHIFSLFEIYAFCVNVAFSKFFNLGLIRYQHLLLRHSLSHCQHDRTILHISWPFLILLGFEAFLKYKQNNQRNKLIVFILFEKIITLLSYYRNWTIATSRLDYSAQR